MQNVFVVVNESFCYPSYFTPTFNHSNLRVRFSFINKLIYLFHLLFYSFVYHYIFITISFFLHTCSWITRQQRNYKNNYLFFSTTLTFSQILTYLTSSYYKDLIYFDSSWKNLKYVSPEPKHDDIIIRNSEALTNLVY